MKRNSDLIVLIILWIVSISSIVIAYINSYILGLQNYVAYGLLIIISILRYFKIKKIKTIIGITLLIGTFNIIQFTFFSEISRTTFSVINNSFTIKFQFFSFLLLMFLIIMNFSEVKDLIREIFTEDTKAGIDRQKRMFEKNYTDLKNEDNSRLQKIIDNKEMYHKEYVRAAQKVIYEREIK